MFAQFVCFFPHCWACPRLANVCILTATLRGRALLLSLAYSGVPQHGYGAEHHCLGHWRGTVTLELAIPCVGYWYLKLAMGERMPWVGKVPVCLMGDPEMEVCLGHPPWVRHHVQTCSRSEIHGLKASPVTKLS